MSTNHVTMKLQSRLDGLGNCICLSFFLDGLGNCICLSFLFRNVFLIFSRSIPLSIYRKLINLYTKPWISDNAIWIERSYNTFNFPISFNLSTCHIIFHLLFKCSDSLFKLI